MVNFCKSKKSLVGKIAIVTGANTGIGYETALEFAKRGGRVILGCRNAEKASEAKYKIINATGNDNVVVKAIDMASLESVRNFAKEINTEEDRLDILVNNAGAGYLEEKITSDGLQLTMQVNYFGPFLLTQLLLDLLKKSAPSRIINVASQAAQFLTSYNLDNLNKFTGKNTIYAQTKLCQILSTQELAKRLEGTGVTTYSLHPGAIHTDFQRFSAALDKVAGWFFLNPEEGAQTQIYLSLQDGIEDQNGKHFHDCKPVKPYCAAKDPEKAKDLYERSLKFVGLSDA